jgi:Fe-S oxidoreductase
VRFTAIDEVCCGGPTYVVGMPQVDSLVEHNLATILGTGTNKVLTSCPRCYLTLSQGPGYAEKLEVQHLADFLAGFDWQPMTGEIVTYHDPCELGRHRGEYDQVRQVLRQVAPQFVEMPHNRESGVCCGAGGGLRGPHTRLSRDVARGRLAEAMATGASVLVTECGSCLHNFHNARRSRDNVEIYGLSEYLNRLMQEHNTSR